jgi:hypothetical protein
MKFHIILSLFILSFNPSLFAQVQYHVTGTDYNKLCKSVIDEYGFDQVLVNGVLYDEQYLNKIGHQFFLENRLYKGILVYRGKEYKGIEMKYDIYNQNLILFLQYNNSIVRIVPSNDFISAFSIGDIIFSKYNFQGEPRFYQVVFDGDKIKCLYYWSKEKYEYVNNSKYISYLFVYREKKKFLILKDKFLAYKNNRSFMEIFPDEIRSRVKKYLSDNHIKVAKSSDEIIYGLFTYCDTLF